LSKAVTDKQSALVAATKAHDDAVAAASNATKGA
jgi:hypothetical protein